MKAFNIEIITRKPKKIHDLSSHEGRITIGDFSEKFVISLSDWPVEKYVQQWRDGCKRLIDHHYSCLVTAVQNLDKNALILIWSLYKQGYMVFIQNHLFNKEILRERKPNLNLAEFNQKNCYDLVPCPKQKHTEDGYEISEWSISADDFFASVKDILKR